ncbi:MAG: ADP-ribosylglycohydrolase family protein [Bellilinea sp.]|nr:ADP-ribosylglycohydrolase family protein [Bellilinea sp.]
MLGAIVGDVLGSVYEHHPIQTEDFDLFHPDCIFTDDTVMTVAIAHAILRGQSYAAAMKFFGRLYPDAGYGGQFIYWIFEDEVHPYNSWGNGAAMRVSPIGFAYPDIETVLINAAQSAEVSHNHPEGIRGAQATALAVFLAKQGAKKTTIREEINRRFGYDLTKPLREIRASYCFDVSCQGTVPPALIAFFESQNYEDAIRKAISLGGDSDTLACITGGIAHAYYQHIPTEIVEFVRERLPDEFIEIFEEFEAKFL